MTALSQGSGLSVETISRLVHRTGAPTDPTLAAVASALALPLTRVRQWADRPAGESDEYVPPREVNQLDRRQRKVLTELIRTMSRGFTPDIVLTLRDGTTLALEIKVVNHARRRPEADRGTGQLWERRIYEILSDALEPELSSAVRPSTEAQPTDRAPIPSSTSSGKSNMIAAFAQIQDLAPLGLLPHADDLVDEAHERGGQPPSDVAERAAAHDDEGDE